MKYVRKAEERGHVEWDWLDTYHTPFSFGEYYDPQHVQWGPLRVMNDDTIAGGGGFSRRIRIATWKYSPMSQKERWPTRTAPEPRLRFTTRAGSVDGCRNGYLS